MKSAVNKFMINEQICHSEVRVINKDGEQLGVMSVKKALGLARDEGLDLVNISPNAKPPVCRIVDYGKLRYELERKEKESRKKQKITEVKEIQLSPNIDSNDLQTKMNHAKKFLDKGNKVKVVLRFRGRELKHLEHSRHVLDGFVEALKDVAAIEKAAKVESRNLTVVLSPRRK